MKMGTDLKICFIDDIRTVVEGISQQIQWDQHGITVCGTAINGLEGMALIENYRPDIILTDIRMPMLDGLELTSRIKETLPAAKVILMTGYSDFEYAKQAVQLGAFDFITKPFSLSHIEEVVLKAKAEIEDERHKENRMAEMEQKVTESLPILRQEFFTLLLHHKADQREAERRWSYIKPDLVAKHLFVMVIEIDGFAEKCVHTSISEIELIRFSLQNIMEETIAPYTRGLIFRDTTTRFAAVLNTTEVISAAELAEACCGNIEAHTSFTISIGIGLPADQIYELSSSYNQAVQALSYHLYTGGNAVMSYADMSYTAASIPLNLRVKEQELIHALQSGNRIHTLKILNQLFDELTTVHPLLKPEYLISLFYELSFMMLRALQEKIPYADLAGIDALVRGKQMTSSISIEDMQRILKDIAGLGCQQIERQTRSTAANVVQEAILYVREHLHQEFYIGDAAKHVHLSTSYFANLFKKVTGMTFNQFVIQERMEQAKRLLLEDRQVQEIAEALGYVERRYFSDVFKKYTRMTPSEFKQTYIGKNLNL